MAVGHHFVFRNVEREFVFAGGNYELQLFAKVLGSSSISKLIELTLTLPDNQGPTIAQIMDAGAIFEWDVEKDQYVSRIERRLT